MKKLNAAVNVLNEFSVLFPLCFSSSCPSTLTKVAKVDEKKRCIHVHLFTDKNFHDPDRSLNRQMAQSELLKQQPDVFLTSHRFSMMVFHLLTLCPPANVYFFSFLSCNSFKLNF